MSIQTFTRTRCPDLADFLDACCTSPLSFDGDDPNGHSADNHIHLWSLEWWADHHDWIDVEYRVDFAETILEAWRGRLTGLAPYQADGYRLYLYQDMAPTVSAVAETPFGYPYPGEPTFVATPREVMETYVSRGWGTLFACDGWDIPQERILETVERNSGSIGKATADALGLKVGKLRTMIEQMGLDREVNALRKRFKRRPANFRPDDELPYRYLVYERRLPARYR